MKLSASILARNPHLNENGKVKPANVQIPGEHKSTKYRNKRVIVDNIAFDSKKESCHYLELKFLQSIGEISDLKLQVEFQLSVCKYVADFSYIDKGGAHCVVDVKSKATRKLPVYRLKKKMMLNELGISIIEK